MRSSKRTRKATKAVAAYRKLRQLEKQDKAQTPKPLAPCPDCLSSDFFELDSLMKAGQRITFYRCDSPPCIYARALKRRAEAIERLDPSARR